MTIKIKIGAFRIIRQNKIITFPKRIVTRISYVKYKFVFF